MSGAMNIVFDKSESWLNGDQIVYSVAGSAQVDSPVADLIFGHSIGFGGIGFGAGSFGVGRLRGFGLSGFGDAGFGVSVPVRVYRTAGVFGSGDYAVHARLMRMGREASELGDQVVAHRGEPEPVDRFWQKADRIAWA